MACIQQNFSENIRSKTQQKILQLGQNGYDLVVLSELFLSEYFCQTQDAKNFNLAQDFKKECDFWAEVAKKADVVLVASLFEKRTAGLYHNTTVVFEKTGQIAGQYRKMHIPQDLQFEEKFYFTPGDANGFEPIGTSIGQLGVLICWDQWYPEAARIMALKGAQILIYPTAIGWFDEDASDEKKRQLEAWMIIQQSHAIANGCFVVAANRCGFEAHPQDSLKGIRFWGNSFIAGCQGEILAQANDQEQILSTKIDLLDMVKTRNIWPFFRDRRIDAYGDLMQRFCHKSSNKGRF